MRALHRGLAFLAGITGGGALHLWFLSEAVVARLQQRGISAFGWSVKSPGETLGAYFILYLLACSLPFVLALLLAASALTERRMHGAARAVQWRLGGLAAPLAWTLLGVAGAAGANLWLLEGEYRDAAASGEWFAVATIAVGIPAMRDFTARYLLVVSALLALVALAARLAGRRPSPGRGMSRVRDGGR